MRYYDPRQDRFNWEASSEETGASRNSDPDTSRDAGESLSADALSRLYEIVVECLRRYKDGLTSHEIAHKTGIAWTTISPRMAPLRRRGLVYYTGIKRSWYGSPGNPSSTRMSMVWQLTAYRPDG